MAFGKSIELKWMTRSKPLIPRETQARDRSLNGKKRIKARKAENKK